MNAELDRYAVMGNPVRHSLSPLIHAWFAEQTHQALVYEAIEVPLGGFPEAVARFQAEGGRGLNVTVPFKEEAWALADERNRGLARAQALVARFGDQGALAARRYEDLDGTAFDVVINGTSASLAGELPPLPEGCVQGAAVYDMMYGARPTPFLDWAAAAGARHTADGLGMLVEQAAEAFLLWRGVRPRTEEVLADLRDHLARGC